MTDNKFNIEECPHCLGTKNVWNGEDFTVCPLCKGSGTIQKLDNEDDDADPEFLNIDDLFIDPEENYDEEAFP